MIKRTARDGRQRRILIGLALMFFAPLGLSFYLYYGKNWRPGGHVNAGVLIEPARPLPPLALPLAGVHATTATTATTAATDASPSTNPDTNPQAGASPNANPRADAGVGASPKPNASLNPSPDPGAGPNVNPSANANIDANAGASSNANPGGTDVGGSPNANVNPGSNANVNPGSNASANPGETSPQFLKGKWTFLYVQHGRCDDECRRHLYDTRQVRLALDREMQRVQRVFIGDGDCCDMQELKATHPDLIAILASPADEPLLALLPIPAGIVNAHRVYLIDPLGNAMMFYAPDVKSKGMLEDMKRLLRLSSIG